VERIRGGRAHQPVLSCWLAIRQQPVESDESVLRRRIIRGERCSQDNRVRVGDSGLRLRASVVAQGIFPRALCYGFVVLGEAVLTR